MLLFTVSLSIFAITQSVASSSSDSCSALQAFVEVRTSSPVSSLKNDTLISTQALFPPHTYNVPWTELVVLSSNDDICSSSATFSVNITNKMILLFESIGDCSAHSKVFVAEINGASAVLIANNDLTGNVINIVDDNLLGYDTTIPMRSISKNDGELLYDEVQSDHGVEVRFVCPDEAEAYPSVVCLMDPSGTFSDFSGNYQQQADKSNNDHPVWKLNGYANVRSDIYLYLYDADGDSDWYWISSFDNTFGTNFKSGLKCNVGGSAVPDPTFCPLWLGTTDHGDTFTSVASIDVTSNMCPVGGETLCVDSTQHELAGLRGEYTLHSNGEPIWYRELTDCDMRAGYLSYIADGDYGTGYFAIDEPLNHWVIALCSIPQEWSENGTFATAKWKPELCNEWMTRDDIGLRYTPIDRYYDPTLNITIGECAMAHTHTPQCVETEIPKTICLANNSIIHGALMGEYMKLNETGPYFDSAIYQRIPYDNPIITNDTDILYIWYANEFFAHFGYGDYLHRREWMITYHSLDEAMTKGTFSYFGLCQGYAFGNVANCAGWVFYAGAFHYDEEMTVTESECSKEPFPTVVDVWPQHVCVGLKDETHQYGDALSTLKISDVVGVYILNESVPSDSAAVPAYVKISNDDETTYLWFSDEWGISNESAIKMLCDPYNNAKTLNPTECKVWYDKDWERLDNIYLYECYGNGTAMVQTTEPVSLCLSRDGSIQSLLEGIYQDSMGYRDDYGTLQFVLQNEYLDNTVYLWYHDSKWWLSPYDYHSKTESNTENINVYGYCEGGERGTLPVCESCWRFYWDLSPLDSDSKYIEDCLFTLYWNTSVCQQTDVYDGEIDYVDTLCVNQVENDNYKDIHRYEDEYSDDFDEYEYEDVEDVPIQFDALLGEYDLKKDYYKQGYNPIYIWHSEVMNHWFIGRTLYGAYDALLLCHDKNVEKSEGIPRECLVWDEEDEISKHVDNMLSVTQQCIKYRSKESLREKAILGIGIGIGVIVFVICCTFIVLLWLKHRSSGDKVHQSVDVVETEFVPPRPSKILGTEKDAITSAGSTGGYDMTTLNDYEAVDPVNVS